MEPATEEDAVADIMGQHDQFVSSMQSRLAKLQVAIISFVIIHFDYKLGSLFRWNFFYPPLKMKVYSLLFFHSQSKF